MAGRNKPCSECGQTIPVSRGNRSETCGVECAATLRRRRQRERLGRDERQVECVTCSGWFTTFRSRQVCCSAECARVARSAADAERQRARRESDPLGSRNAARRSHRERTYGLTADEFDTLFASQQGRCAICARGLLSDFDDGSSGRLAPHVDHDHRTGEVRGLLCRSCNRGIGMLWDDASLCRKAAEYLEAHNGDGSSSG